MTSDIVTASKLASGTGECGRVVEDERDAGAAVDRRAGGGGIPVEGRDPAPRDRAVAPCR
jgi:hypothetical protein